MIIRTWRINVLYEDSNRSQESAVFHDHEAINTLTDMMSWVFITIQLQDHILIWQARLKVWHANMIITRFAHECRWWMNCELISDFVVFRIIWENITCFHKSWIQWKENWNQQIKYKFWWLDKL